MFREWIYKHGYWLWFECPLTTREAVREIHANGWYVWRGIRWRWLTKVFRWLTGRKLSYWGDLARDPRHSLL